MLGLITAGANLIISLGVDRIVHGVVKTAVPQVTTYQKIVVTGAEVAISIVATKIIKERIKPEIEEGYNQVKDFYIH